MVLTKCPDFLSAVQILTHFMVMTMFQRITALQRPREL